MYFTVVGIEFLILPVNDFFFGGVIAHFAVELFPETGYLRLQGSQDIQYRSQVSCRLVRSRLFNDGLRRRIRGSFRRGFQFRACLRMNI